MSFQTTPTLLHKEAKNRVFLKGTVCGFISGMQEIDVTKEMLSIYLHEIRVAMVTNIFKIFFFLLFSDTSKPKHCPNKLFFSDGVQQKICQIWRLHIHYALDYWRGQHSLYTLLYSPVKKRRLRYFMSRLFV